ncbi:NAD(P)(+) transhydrogenase (Re/Si-specific) subunit beta [Paraflavitalea speifideaquila]|uniref:NAD(P)(+) transhydrogenase (Re/Si-specific) subunit beta n=1 Tax=Paraflavitalea speifideaquila TaxID=3076558 RepID=UPI00331308B1
MEFSILTLCYLIGSVTFIIGLKMLSNPATARKGNLIAAVGMTIAIIGTIFLYRDEDTGEKLHNYLWIFSGLLIGGIVGTLTAKKVKMTAMPEMVSLFNGMGGACAALISIIEFGHYAHAGFKNSIQEAYEAGDQINDAVLSLGVQTGVLITIFAGLIIGSVSFAGSMIAWGKLNGKIKDFAFKGQHIVNQVILVAILALSTFLIYKIKVSVGSTDDAPEVALNIAYISMLFYAVLGLSLLYGILFVMPIGGADMPVVISLLNSFTGVAAACGGFLYDNKVMLTGGILVGAAGTLLTILMCKAMNRSLLNVLIGSFGGGNNNSGGGGAKKTRAIIKKFP